MANFLEFYEFRPKNLRFGPKSALFSMKFELFIRISMSESGFLLINIAPPLEAIEDSNRES